MPSLNFLLMDGLSFDAEYEGGMSNHLPMALIALHRLGGDATRLAAFAERYRERLEPLPPRSLTIDGDRWTEELGNIRHYSAYLDFFGTQLRAGSRAETLARFLPPLWRGVSAGAFHALIRLAYGLEADHVGEIAAGLAYWASRWQPAMPPSVTVPDVVDPGTVLAALSSHPDLSGANLTADLIFERMALACRLPGFADTVGNLVVGGATVSELARLARHLYAEQRDFTSLHLVTATHALRLLLPLAPEPEEAIRAYWHAFCAAYVSIGAPSIGHAEDLRELPPADWRDILANAVASDNDHVIKLTHTCQEEFRTYGDPVYRAIARRITKTAAPVSP